ncbi:hypothetical protein TPHA_0K01170 [Tetrapisispora phaffii CBS 4417]|uniref:HIT domain-containing protein n=1 Tax=Tetrapisispora phaffii (strain ATCC 24235 / CBS 4417 / NBRC 1672 / NRRL Y-8282 / UCD 70-5) TaxID=1071381 RepID=G8BZC3_TETPH|nr:hypothetical protein TPHA_0K01170 [Tetrapisispora phaffii CBS 4417]CCE65251.1 hypothetical protein TPHA_0K01170 [Tetrapisispora phaffii CBS 4417]
MTAGERNIKELLEEFKFEKILNSNPQNKMISVLGSISKESDAIVVIEKSHFLPDTQSEDIKSLTGAIEQLFNNDCYFTGVTVATEHQISQKLQQLKVNLIYPATTTHIQKQLQQKFHMITETPTMYENIVKPYIDDMYKQGRLKWVHNILYEGAEAERIVYQNNDMMVLPDMKWDGENMDTFYLVALIKRLDIKSLRDLNQSHIPYLKQILCDIKTNIPKLYNNQINADELRIFIHYQPSYYHFHIHIVNILHLGLGNGLVAGKAWLLEDILDQLENMAPSKDGFKDRTLTYALGENHELWSKFK